MTTTHAEHLEAFLAFSAAATAFSTFELHGTGQAEAYLATVTDIVGSATMAELLAADAAIREAAGEDVPARDRLVRARILSDDRLGPVARNIMKLWYLGTWFAMPPEWTEQFGVGGDDRTFVVSPSSYAEGLVWPAIGANPPGAKGPGYGTWTSPPQIATA